MASTGYIKLNRKFFNNPFWTKQRVYSEAEAWIDLIQSARFDGTTEYVNNRLIELERGELPVSIRYNAKRWSWGEQKVRTFFEILLKNKMITQREHSGQRIINLVNYGVYNDKQHSEEAENNTLITHQQHTDNTAITQNIRSKEGEEIKNKRSKRKIPFSLEIFLKENLLPFSSEKFIEKFNILLLQEKWKRKSEAAIIETLEEMKKYDEDFVIAQMSRAISSGWQGLFYANTYSDYLKSKTVFNNGKLQNTNNRGNTEAAFGSNKETSGYAGGF